jgi:glycosyltransferase involved in cell wall biosynthesis
MRILNVTETYAPFLEFGGPPVKVKALARGLAERGHEVTVLTADWGFERRRGDAKLTAAERSPFGWKQTEDGVTAIYLSTWLKYRTATWNPAVKRFCRSRVAEFDVAHIYGLYDFLGPAVAAACAKRNIPYVLEPIGMYVPMVRSVALKRIYHAVYGRAMIAGASAVVATSEQEVRELAEGGIPPGKIQVRRNGVEVPAAWPGRGEFRKRYKIADGANVILFLGRLSSKKSPELLLEAFALLRGQNVRDDLQLVFAGPDDDGMQERLARAAEQRGLTPDVHFTGPIFGDDKWSAYCDADVFVLPSQNENFGNAAAEAAAAGTPVVVTENCGIASLLGEVAGLVVPHDPQAVAGAVRRVISDEGLRARLKEGCRHISAQLGWEEPVREMETLYNSLAIKRAASAKS